jgi:endonuclease-3
MKIKDRYLHILNYFNTNHPQAETELLYRNPFELLVAVILSAQCTDKRVNETTPIFFKRFIDVFQLAEAEVDEVFQYIKSISYPNNKAKHLVGMAKLLIENFNAEVPSTLDELVTLPGVGRKTANVILSVIFEKPTMAVDTHVFRVSERIGLTSKAKTPLDAELQLMKHIPEEMVAKAHHWLILHGRYICVARNPKCNVCELTQWCKFYSSHV